MKLLVCGSHTSTNPAPVLSYLDSMPAPDLLINGGAPGVDSFAKQWAMARGIPCATYDAPWKSWRGRGAGPARNGWMLRFGQPDLVLAFPGGPGTENMITQAERMKVEVRRVV